MLYNTNINTTTVSLQRAYLGTTAAAHSSGDTATSGTYNLFPATGAIQKEARYDLRVYAENESGLGSIQYLVFDDTNLKTDSIGAPAIPTGLSLSVASSEQINSSWTKPSDHDTTTAGIQDSPFISIYKVSYTPTATTRVNNFGALFGGNALSTAENLGYSPNTEPSPATSNAATSESLTSLNPGTTYSVKVAAKNAQNSSYGSYTAAETATTSSPSAPSFITSSDANALNNVATLRSPYSSSGGYKTDGTSQVSTIVRFSNINDTTQPLRTTSATGVRTNNTESDLSGNAGTATALGGVDGAEDSATQVIPAFNSTDGSSFVSDQNVDATKVRLRVDNEHDHYYKANSTNYDHHGFYKSVDLYAQGLSSGANYPASTDLYTLQVRYTINGGYTLRR